MANNRMWLVNEKAGLRLLLAKYYPSAGWSTWNADTLGHALQTALEVANNKCPDESAWGRADWTIEYEVEPKSTVAGWFRIYDDGHLDWLNEDGSTYRSAKFPSREAAAKYAEQYKAAAHEFNAQLEQLVWDCLTGLKEPGNGSASR